MVTETKRSCAYVLVTNLFLMVDICLCSNQTLHYWKMSFLAGDIQRSCTSLEVENIYSDSTTTIQQYTPTHVATHNTMKAGKYFSAVITGMEDGLVYVKYMCTSQELSSLHEVKPSSVLTILCNVHIR